MPLSFLLYLHYHIYNIFPDFCQYQSYEMYRSHNSSIASTPLPYTIRKPRSLPHSYSQCLVITIRSDNTFVRCRGITILEESNLAPALRCNHRCDLRSRRVTFTLLLLPADSAFGLRFNQLCFPVALLQFIVQEAQLF